MEISYEEKKIAEQLAGYRTDYESTIYALTHLRRAAKKDGTPFANLNANYPDAKVTIERSYSGYVSGVKISGTLLKKTGPSWGYISINLYPKTLNTFAAPSFEDVEEAIKERIQLCQENLTKIKAQQKALHSAFAKCEKVAKRLIDTLNAIPEVNDGKYHSTLGYRLFEHARKLIY